MLKLHIQDDEGKTNVVPLEGETVTIGRQEGNTIRLSERNVSRRHAVLKVASGGVVLEELQARYGTRLNGAKIKGSQKVGPGDVIQIGDYKLALESEELHAQAPNRKDGDPDASRTAVGRAADGSTSIIDIGTLGESIDDDTRRAIPAKHQSRLVTTSRNVQARDFVITSTPCIIGRTDDNDVVVDHRSISRNHAKILWNGATYTIVDLDSANGVKVNGDLYKRTDLHNGDDIEFGHVMMKFIGAGDDIPAGIARDIPVGKAAGGGAGKFMAIGLAVLAIGIAVAWFGYFGKEPGAAPKPTTAAVKPPESPGGQEGTDGAIAAAPSENPSAEPSAVVEPAAEKPVEPVAVPAAPEVPVAKGPDAVVEANPTAPPTAPVVAPEVAPAAAPEKTSAEQATAIIEAAQKKLDADQFADARSLLSEALKLDPNAKGADDLLLKIASEEKGQEALETAKKAAAKEDWLAALEAVRDGLKEAPKSKAAAALTELEGQATRALADQFVAKGDRYMREKFYKQAVTAYRQALTYDPNNEKAKKGLKAAQAQVKEPVVTAEKPEKPVVEKPEKPVVEKPVAAEGGSKLDKAKALLDEAKAAKRASNLPQAEKLYKECLATHPGMIQCRGDLAVILMA
ncbi:MAG: FHA domain-containing protein, partial [Myxococcales bacterium]|nr:FHA domain-containing protein [Myxococcales bacterium]